LTDAHQFRKKSGYQTHLSQAEEFSPPSSSPLPDLQSQNQYGGEKKGNIHELIHSV
jgi:hypothetical protein